ncbi:MAG: right-handed parallel beta-helix repeat-containing protein [Patescibacteria group bacterium]|jgi:parallel beta-helix repeat protein
MKRIIVFTGILIISLFLVKTGYAAEYYIDAASGNDANAGSESAPWQSLSKINSITGGDTVYLKGDFVITSQIDITSAVSGTSSDYTSINIWPGYNALIDIAPDIYNLNIQASYLDINNLQFHNNGTLAANGNAITLADGIQYIIIDHCNFSDAQNAIYGDGTVGGGISEVEISANWFTGNYNGIKLDYTSNADVYKNYFYNNSNYGADTTYTDNVLINNNIFYYNRHGIIEGGSADLKILNNTFYHNTSYGIGTEITTSVLIKNNIFDSNDYALLNILGTSFVTDNNLFNNNNFIGGSGFPIIDYSDLSSWQALGFDASSLEGDPVFTSIASGTEDFNLLAGSPAIDSGSDLSAYFSSDYANSPRPQGSAFDIGAYEYTSPPTNLTAVNTQAKDLTLTWDASCTSCTYSLAYSTVADFSANVNTVENILTTTQLVDGLKSAKQYYWKIKSNNGIYDSEYTSVLTAPTKPSQVKQLHINNITNNEADSEWAKQKRVKHYIVALMDSNRHVLRRITVQISQSYLTGSARKVKKTITHLSADKEYKIKVRAKRKMNGTWYKGKWSDVKTFDTLSN